MNCFLGFVSGVVLCLIAYLAWEDYRHVPVIIKEKEIRIHVPVPIPIPVPSTPPKNIAPQKPKMRVA